MILIEPATNWDVLKKEFSPNECFLRDMLIQKVDLKDWDNLLSRLKSSKWTWTFTLDQQPAKMPESLREITQLRDQFSLVFSLHVDGLEFNCFFHDIENIEFDLLAEDISSIDRLQSALEFMQEMGRACNKPVIMTFENTPEAIIFKVEPSLGHCRFYPESFRIIRDPDAKIPILIR